MIIVDTSVWVDHLRDGDAELRALLDEEEVLIHPLVIGELAVGRLPDRQEVLLDLYDLPSAVVAEDDEVVRFITGEALFGLGIGYIDAHLLASARLTRDAKVWTRDRRMAVAAARLGVGHGLPH